MASFNPKLIHLNGPAGIGKDTIAKRYTDTHPLALCIRTDEIITTIGDWSSTKNYDPARHLAFDIALSMIATHLKNGHDVIVPHLLTDLDEAEALEKVAQDMNAPFIEILLSTDKNDALDRVFERGTRGEPGAPPLTPDDRDEFEELYDNVYLAADTRVNLFRITSAKGDIDGTYQKVVDAINSVSKTDV
ncbi:MAG TPA: AAA family ATPase [Candidatus Saccharimonadales bacterium]|nr:AAA family ATPase [Candidatus Saccharimonadales bacterium]